MMCIACQQDFMWLAYLESQAFAGADKGTTATERTVALEDKPAADAGEVAPVEQNKFSCDDPTAG